MKKQPTRMRDQMPIVAAFLDELRQEYGVTEISAAIRSGMAGGTDFYATEGDYEIGYLPPPPSGRYDADYLLDNRSLAATMKKDRP